MKKLCIGPFVRGCCPGTGYRYRRGCFGDPGRQFECGRSYWGDEAMKGLIMRGTRWMCSRRFENLLTMGASIEYGTLLLCAG